MTTYCLYNKSSCTKLEYIDAFTKYLLTTHQEQIILILNEPEKSIHYSVTINVLDLMMISQRLGTLLLAYPNEMLPYFDLGILDAQKTILKEETGIHEMIFKPYCHARLHNLPMCSEIAKSTISSIRANDIRKFISVPGTIIRTGSVKMLQSEKSYICSTCKEEFKVVSEIEKGNVLAKPSICGNSDCPGTNFKAVEESEICRDYQEIKVQDKISSLHLGSIPRSISVVLQDDLVDVCKAGDDVVLTGMICPRWKPLRNDTRCEIEILMICNHVVINNVSKGSLSVTEEQKNEFISYWKDNEETPLKARNFIVRSMCPQIYGLYLVKLALGLTLIGGVAETRGNTRVRGESHLLLVGDPGCGKSQFLKYASKLSPRNVLTNGIGTTSAGLTVMAAKDSTGEWTLEAGALVLADGGICCIDEFDSIREHDRATIHEAMEQQTLSIAKAGLVCKLNSRTTVIAATNPKGKYDISASLSVNCNLASPLLSRFDLVLILLDTQDEVWDTKVSNFILRGEDVFNDAYIKSLWSFEKLQSYICYIKQIFHPKILPESGKVLAQYYRVQRALSDRVAARTTIRLLESLIRIAQAHARLMFRNEVTIQDAIMAVLIVDSSMHASNLIGMYSVLHSEFPEDADEQYRVHEKIVLEKLGLATNDLDGQESLEEEFDFTGDRDDEFPSPAPRPQEPFQRKKTQFTLPKYEKLSQEEEYSPQEYVNRTIQQNTELRPSPDGTPLHSSDESQSYRIETSQPNPTPIPRINVSFFDDDDLAVKIPKLRENTQATGPSKVMNTNAVSKKKPTFIEFDSQPDVPPLKMRKFDDQDKHEKIQEEVKKMSQPPPPVVNNSWKTKRTKSFVDFE